MTETSSPSFLLFVSVQVKTSLPSTWSCFCIPFCENYFDWPSLSSECNVWFDGASKKRKRDFEGERISKHVRTLADQNLREANRPDFSVPNSQEASVPSSELEEMSISAFKRIRFDTGLQALTYQELIKLIDLKRDQIPYSDLQLREMFYKHHDHGSIILDRSWVYPSKDPLRSWPLCFFELREAKRALSSNECFTELHDK